MLRVPRIWQVRVDVRSSPFHDPWQTITFGRSQLLDFTINNFSSADGKAVAFYYFRYSGGAAIEDIVKVLLYQLYLQSTHPLDAYGEMRQKSQNNAKLSVSQLLSVLERTITQFEHVCIVLDGIDGNSNDQHKRLLQLIDVIVTSRAALLATSRQLFIFEERFLNFD